MFVRIVKLGFHEEYIDTFLSNFEENKEQIRTFNGCKFLELYRDKTNPNIFFTYSYWNLKHTWRHIDNLSCLIPFGIKPKCYLV